MNATRMTDPYAVSVADGIAELVLDNPPVNAFDTAAQFALAAEIEALGRRDDVLVIVIAANGKGFCAGIDVKEVAADPSRIVEVNRANYDTFAAIHLNPKPVIAAVHGYVLGGGVGIAGSADVVVAAEDAYFGVPEIDRGGMGMGAHLQRMFGVQKVRYMYFTGEPVGASEAYRLGALERVVPSSELRASARAIAARMASKSPAMMRIAKRSLTGVENGSLEDKYRWEQGFTFEAYMLADSVEARRAFFDKRAPEFAGRPTRSDGQPRRSSQ